MDELMQFIIRKDPSILIYKAIFEMIDGFKYPIESREHFLSQLIGSDRALQDRQKGSELVEEFFPAYLFPMVSKQNALEKITEVVESIRQDLKYTVPRQQRSMWSVLPGDPACEFHCERVHAEMILDIMAQSWIAVDIFRETLSAEKERAECLRRCKSAAIPAETRKRAQEPSA